MRIKKFGAKSPRSGRPLHPSAPKSSRNRNRSERAQEESPRSRARSTAPKTGGYRGHAAAPATRERSFGRDESRGGYRGHSAAPASGRTPHAEHSTRGGYRGASAAPSRAPARSFGRPSFGSRSGGSRNGGGRGRGFNKNIIDEARFINKATKSEQESYDAKHVFNDFGIHEKLAANLAAKGFVKPSAIQDQAIPVVLTGKDIIGIAATGTGKTAAFLIPLINKLVANPNQKILVLSPTRELATQIEDAFQDFTKGMNLFSVTCVGGAPIYRQIRELRQGVHAVIGTPGRVKDLMLQGKINMKGYTSVVLDEADRMLDMGFIDDMRFILGEMPEDRQSLFFSATFSDEIRALCRKFLKDPTTIAIKSRDTASAVEQNIVRVRDEADKIEKLSDILNGDNANKVLIFREMKRHVDGLAETLNKRGFRVLALHGDMRNRERERAVQALASGTVQAVIATDVAARGIDIADITMVVNYDLPNDYDTYVHRIGRTGRASKSGHALTFVPERKQWR
ncbi:MAG TPA: DEAD/DEAH box helicase [Candidatus Paceibacterota bacterium]|nr:DEAD/DEAH box helicase [Candidatus Paceibacterota bacterium]